MPFSLAPNVKKGATQNNDFAILKKKIPRLQIWPLEAYEKSTLKIFIHYCDKEFKVKDRFD